MVLGKIEPAVSLIRLAIAIAYGVSIVLRTAVSEQKGEDNLRWPWERLSRQLAISGYRLLVRVEAQCFCEPLLVVASSKTHTQG